MDMDELLVKLDSLVDAIGQTMAIMSGTLAEVRGPDHVLRQMLGAKGAMEFQHGDNEWRDRLTEKMLRIVALKARPFAQDDPELQALIASVLESPVGRSKKH